MNSEQDSSNSYNNNNRYSNNRSMRPDGSYRPYERLPRPGYAAEGENSGKYAIPPRRTAEMMTERQDTFQVDAVRLEEDSWADEEAPLVKQINAVEANTVEVNAVEVNAVEVNAVEEPIEANQANETSEMNSQESTIEASDSAVKPRIPSKIATAIDDALDTLSLGGSSTTAMNSNERPMGRFATLIARDEERGYRSESGGYERGYERNYDRGYDRNFDRNGDRGYERNYDRNNDRNYDRGYNREYRNWNRNNNAETAPSNEATAPTPATSTSKISRSASNGECPRLKECLEMLSKYRREMAVINAKLEYIRYMCGAKGEEEMTPVELSRVQQEPELLAKINSIYENIDALEIE